METDRGRVHLVAGIVALIAIVFASRLFYIQVAKGAYFYNLADDQYRSGGQYGVYERGNIYFSLQDGAYLTAAGLASGYILAINPTLLKDSLLAYTKLSEIVPEISETDFMARTSKDDDPYEEIIHRLTESQKNAIESLKIDGILLPKEQWRIYPASALASHVLGFVGYDEDKFIGRYGVESKYEDNLTRKVGNLYQNFFSGIFEGIKSEVFGEKNDREADVVLSIEPRVQVLVESKADELMSRWGAKGVGISVMDPQTGDIFAMTARPAFDANNLRIEKDPKVFTNPFSQEVFEMGSIMKPITISSAIDSGVIKSDTEYLDKGYIELDGKKIGNYDGKGRGLATMQDVLNQSLNTGAAFAALKMGHESFRNYMYRFGFQDKTGIDLPNETGNLIDNLDSNRDVEIATASFGQGIAVSPISMMRALAALGNGGFLIKPHVVRSLDYKLGYSEETKTTEQGRAISGETSDEITRMLVKVVDEYLAHGKLKFEHYSIAAKTGTAQIANPSDGGYYTDRYFHSFFGYFPAYKPRFLVFLYMSEPQGVNYASETLTEPFRDITKFLISYYNIVPDR